MSTHTCQKHNGDPAYCDACREEHEERQRAQCDVCGAETSCDCAEKEAEDQRRHERAHSAEVLG